MAVNPDAIEPGSLPHGERAQTEELLAGLGNASGGGADPATGGPVGPGGGNVDPLDALLTGNVVPPSGDPLTSGLDVGPGFSPAESQGGPPDEYTERLRLIAEHSGNPALRLLATEMLMKRTRGARRVRSRQ